MVRARLKTFLSVSPCPRRVLPCVPLLHGPLRLLVLALCILLDLSDQITITAKCKTQHTNQSLSIRLAIQLIEQDIKKLSTANQLTCSVTRFVAANDWA